MASKNYSWLSGFATIFRITAVIVIISSIVGYIGLNSFYEVEEIVIFIISAILCILLIAFPLIAFAGLLDLSLEIWSNLDRYNPRKSGGQKDYFDNIPRDLKDQTFEQWSKDHPSKSINDYYATHGRR